MTFPTARYRRLLSASLLLMLAATGSALAEFDHSAFDALLRRSVSNGRVNYDNFRNNAAFTSYLSSLATATTKGMGKNEELAFWINAYNACVIRNVLDHPGMNKPIDVQGFFNTIRFRVAGENRTLDDIEKGIILKRFKTPYVHFGLVCAAISCPPLIPMAYTAGNVKQTLELNARNYLGNSQQNRYTPATNTLYLSKIFEWYSSDFGGTKGTQKFVKKEGTPAMKKGVDNSTRIVYMEYDWSLNAQ